MLSLQGGHVLLGDVGATGAHQRALPLATRNLVLADSVLGEYARPAGAMVLGIEQALSASDISGLM